MKKIIFILILNSFLINIYAQKPNIVFILADDLGYGDLACFGSKVIKTPNLDQLASEGVKLTQFYSGSTVCAPSRAALMTGMHTGHGYIRGNGEVPLRQQDIILPQLLKKAGYNTAMFGKWGLGDVNTSGSVEKKGWDEFTGFVHHVEAHYQMPSTIWHFKTGMKEVERIGVPFFGYGCDIFMKDAEEYLQKQSASKPFFLYLSLPIPHAQLLAPDDAMTKYIDSEGNSVFKEIPYEGKHYHSTKMPKATYAAMVTKADDYVGKVIEILKQQGLYENTVIMFSSDNGTHKEGGRTLADVLEMNSSGGLKGIKRDLTEGGIRVPTIITGPGLPKNTVRDSYGAFWDILPTFLDMVGQASPENIDGISLKKYFTTGTKPKSRPLYWEFTEGGFSQAVRIDDWKYIITKSVEGKTEEQLYNLKDDQAENNNLAKSESEQLKIMSELCQKQRIKSIHPAFRTKEEGRINIKK